MSEPTTQTQPRSRALGMLTQRRGPLPVWAWVALLVAILVLVTVWRRNRRGEDAATDVELPGDQTPPPVFVVPSATPPVVNVTIPPPPASPPGKVTPPTATVPSAPPGGGRSTPPGTGPGIMVPVQHKYTTKNPPWDSTISGIWSHYKTQTTAKSWQELWAHPGNASLRALRGRPENLRLGDKVFVPGVK